MCIKVLGWHIFGSWYLACQDRLLADKRKAKAEGRKLGSCYWAQLKQLYSVTDLEKVLMVKDPSEMVQPKLIEALKQATSTNTNFKSKSLLTTYFAQGSSMNQKELCGVIKHLLRSKVKGNTTSCKCMLQFMKFVIKAGLHEKYPEELDVLRDQFDEAPMQRAISFMPDPCMPDPCMPDPCMPDPCMRPDPCIPDPCTHTLACEAQTRKSKSLASKADTVIIIAMTTIMPCTLTPKLLHAIPLHAIPLCPEPCKPDPASMRVGGCTHARPMADPCTQAAHAHRQPMLASQPSSHPSQVLQWSWAAWSADGLDLSSWYEAYESVVGLVVDPEAMKAIMDLEGGEWSSVKTELGKVTSGSQLGARLFGKAMDMVTSQAVRDAIQDLIHQLPKSKITQKNVDNIMDKISEVTKDMSMKALSQKRIVHLNYRGLEVTLSVTNVMEETLPIIGQHACAMFSLPIGGCGCVGGWMLREELGILILAPALLQPRR